MARYIDPTDGEVLDAEPVNYKGSAYRFGSTRPTDGKYYIGTDAEGAAIFTTKDKFDTIYDPALHKTLIGELPWPPEPVRMVGVITEDQAAYFIVTTREIPVGIILTVFCTALVVALSGRKAAKVSGQKPDYGVVFILSGAKYTAVLCGIALSVYLTGLWLTTKF